jgi:hypothetical protein
MEAADNTILMSHSFAFATVLLDLSGIRPLLFSLIPILDKYSYITGRHLEATTISTRASTSLQALEDTIESDQRT